MNDAGIHAGLIQPLAILWAKGQYENARGHLFRNTVAINRKGKYFIQNLKIYGFFKISFKKLHISLTAVAQ